MSKTNYEIKIGPPRFKLAVQVVVRLSIDNKILSSAMLAKQVDSHSTFVRRVMQSLVDAGIVKSKGGREGGYILKKSAEEITLGEIYSAVIPESLEPLVNEEINEGDFFERLDVELINIYLDVQQRTIKYLQQYTIHDLISRLSL
jgi:Rrf2 family transcriptional regulator, repressor of oqxAB